MVIQPIRQVIIGLTRTGTVGWARAPDPAADTGEEQWSDPCGGAPTQRSGPRPFRLSFVIARESAAGRAPVSACGDRAHRDTIAACPGCMERMSPGERSTA